MRHAGERDDGEARYFTRVLVADFTGLFVRSRRPYDQTQQTKEGAIQPNIWVLVDREGERTLFRLIEVGDAGEAARVMGDGQLPVVMVDVALPSPEHIGPTLRALPGQGRLVVVKVHAASGTDETSPTVAQTPMTDTHPRILWRMDHQESEAQALAIS